MLFDNLWPLLVKRRKAIASNTKIASNLGENIKDNREHFFKSVAIINPFGVPGTILYKKYKHFTSRQRISQETWVGKTFSESLDQLIFSCSSIFKDIQRRCMLNIFIKICIKSSFNPYKINFSRDKKVVSQWISSSNCYNWWHLRVDDIQNSTSHQLWCNDIS